MSPTCSSRFLVGRKTRSAALGPLHSSSPGERPRSPATSSRGSLWHAHSGRQREPCRREPARQRGIRWYVRPALGEEERCERSCLSRRVAGCGGGERQDENEPEGDFAVEVVEATFPEQQKLAKSSDLVITVRNAGDETIPNIAVTVDGLRRRARRTPTWPTRASRLRDQRRAGRDRRLPGGQGRHPARLRHRLREHLGLRPAQAGPEKTFSWTVTAVKAGDFKVNWQVAAGLDGKAKAVAAGGGVAPRGQLHGHDLGRGARRPRGRRRRDRRQRDPLARAARSPGSARRAAAGTSGSAGRSSSARTARTRCRARFWISFWWRSCRRARPSQRVRVPLAA